jgi:hypothetical protein
MRYGIGALLFIDLAGIPTIVDYRRVPGRHGTGHFLVELLLTLEPRRRPWPLVEIGHPTRSLAGTFAFETGQVTREVSETCMDREGDR